MLLKFRSNTHKIDINKSLFLYYMSLKMSNVIFISMNLLQYRQCLIVIGKCLRTIRYKFYCYIRKCQRSREYFQVLFKPNPLFFFTLRWNSHKINHLEVYSSVASSTFTMLSNYHPHLVPKWFHSPQRIYTTYIKQSLPINCPPSSTWQPQVDFLSQWIYLLWAFHINGIMKYMTFCVWCLSISIIILRFILCCDIC